MARTATYAGLQKTLKVNFLFGFFLLSIPSRKGVNQSYRLLILIYFLFLRIKNYVKIVKIYN